ncbi:MAG: ImmA/IrrE family metallo-endopeptidase [Acidimicrobiia bacterium]|nr:ImmA/IrrE family metallo-endopeptidase [Acidimicrobiia bacterium]
MPKSLVPVNNEVVRWAVEESGLSPVDVSRKVGVDVVVLKEWMEGIAKPSRGEFTKLFKTLKRPSALFFAPQAPEPLRIPALRESPRRAGRNLSEQERLWIRRARRLQQLVSFLLQKQGRKADLPRVGREEVPETAGERVRRWLGVDRQMYWGSTVDPWLWWREKLEGRGILVFALQLGKDGVRGFSFSDEVAPVISVNTAYNREARVFTAFHELGHLALQNESVCVDLSGEATEEERWCEEFAASVLLPRDAVLQFVEEASPDEDGFALAKKTASRFKVSIRAAAVRLIRLEIAEQSLYTLVDQKAQLWDRDKGFARGRPTYRTQRRIQEYGNVVVDELIRAADQGLLNLHDLSDYLRLDTTEVDEIAQIVGIR